jgi:hypothetical protein
MSLDLVMQLPLMHYVIKITNLCRETGMYCRFCRFVLVQ